MKIGFVLDDTLDKPDGAQQYVLTLGRWLGKHGHEVHYLVTDTKRTDIKNAHVLSRYVETKFNHNRVRTPLLAKKSDIRSVLDLEQFDVLHVQLPYSPFLGKRVLSLVGPKTAVVGTFLILPSRKWHSTTNRGLRQLLGSSLKRLDKVISISEPAADFAKRIYRLDSAVIPAAVDLSSYQHGKPVEAFRDGFFNIVFLGRFVPRKGIEPLIRAIQALPEKDLPPLRIIMCGDGPLWLKAQRLTRNDKRFTFPGFIQEQAKPDFLVSADIAVFPSTRGESFGIILLEAMAARAGVVVAGDNLGYRALLNEIPDVLVKPEDTAAFAHTLERFIRNESLRRQRHTAQQAIVQAYDVDKIGPRVLEVYHQAIAKRTFYKS